MGGTVTHEPGIIRAAGARLTAVQRDRLAGMQGVLRLYDNDPEAAGGVCSAGRVRAINHRVDPQ